MSEELYLQVSLEDYLKALFKPRMPKLIVKKCPNEKKRVVMYIHVQYPVMECVQPHTRVQIPCSIYVVA